MLIYVSTDWMTSQKPYIKAGFISRKISFSAEMFLYKSNMDFRNLFTGLFLLISIYLLSMQKSYAFGAPPVNNLENNHGARSRSFMRFIPKNPYARLKPDANDFLVVDDDEFTEILKRQTSDDYGHLRFGKRGETQFDDYGHMRFGRSSGSTD